MTNVLAVAPGKVPSDDAAPVVPDQGEAVVAERVGDCEDVFGEHLDRICPYVIRLARVPVPALIRNDDAETCGGKRRDLASPPKCDLWKAVQQDDRRPVLGTGNDAGKFQAVRTYAL